MESLPIPGPQWRSRTPVRRGHIDPPNFGRLIGSRSTVEGRIAEQKFQLEQEDRAPQLKPGMIVILRRAPYRIVEIREIPIEQWPFTYVDEWKAAFDRWASARTDEPAPEQTTWRDRPIELVLESGTTEIDAHARVKASYVWDVLPEHYAVCRSCGELPPCREEEIERATASQMTETLRLMAIHPGACMGCGETIGGRQKTVGFPGPNLWRPDLADGTVRFHARGECAHWVDRYRKQWESVGKPGFVSAVQQLAMGGEA
jgi:hypothetical protein